MHILALDQGTTSSRAIVFDGRGQPVASAQQEFNQHYPQPGWVEQNPAEIWESQLATGREALRRARLDARDLACIGLTNQRETVVCWERASGRPLHRAIVWQDRRTAGDCARLERAGHSALVRERTGLVLDPYFSATKIRWLLDHVDGLRPRAAAGEICFGTVDTWVLYCLTGGQRFVTDVTNASRTLLFDIRRLAWDEGLCDLFGVPMAVLPEVRPSAAVLGEADPALLGARVPITGTAGDQQAALFGQACLRPGMAKNTYGTGSFVVMHSGDQPVQGEGVLTTLAWQVDGEAAEYALEAPIFVTGAAVQWLRDGLGLIRTSAEIEDLATAVTDNGGVYFVPALTGLGAPHWDPYARGLVIGITRGTTRHHLARAALEAMAYQTRDGTEAMQAAAGVGLNVLRADGGAAVNDTLMQFQADILGVPVLRPRVTETTALGAAFLAGLGAGLLSRDDIEQSWALERRFEPAMDAAHRGRLYAGWRRAVERAAHWAEPDQDGKAI